MTIKNESINWVEVGRISDSESGFLFIVEKEVHEAYGTYTDIQFNWLAVQEIERSYTAESIGNWRLTLVIPAITDSSSVISIREEMAGLSFTGFSLAMQKMLELGEKELKNISIDFPNYSSGVKITRL